MQYGIYPYCCIPNTCLFLKKSQLIGLGICFLCTVEGSFNHDGLVVVEKQPFLIIMWAKKTEGPSVAVGSDEYGDIEEEIAQNAG